MTKTLEATFDGEVFRPDEPIELAPNTRVRVTIETTVKSARKPFAFFEVARSLDLDGPPDWALNFDDYLYGTKDGIDE
jgi:hypothetical protein